MPAGWAAPDWRNQTSGQLPSRKETQDATQNVCEPDRRRRGTEHRCGRGPGAEEVKIGFIVKQPEEPWFQDEWKFASQAAKDKGFTLVKIGAQSGDKVITAIDNLAAQKAQGFVICTPDVKLGPGIVAKAKADNPEDDHGRRPSGRRHGQADRERAAHGHLGDEDRRAGRRGDRRGNEEARLGSEGNGARSRSRSSSSRPRTTASRAPSRR